MRVLVTGATGFIGRHLVCALAAEGHEVVSSSRAATGPPEAKRHIQWDVSALAPPQVVGLDAIVHLAAHASAEDPDEDPTSVVQTNVQGTLHALLLARQMGASFVLASSQRVYATAPEPRSEDSARTPSTVYGYTKLAAELYADMAGRLWGVPGAILRFFSVYGPGQFITRGTSGVVSILAQRAIQGEPLVVMGRQRRDFLAVSDAVAGIIAALKAPQRPPRAYNIAAGVGTGIPDLARLICSAAGSGSPIIEQRTVPETGDLVADISRARRELGYSPQTSLPEGLRTYVDWLRATRPRSAQGQANPGTAR